MSTTALRHITSRELFDTYGGEAVYLRNDLGGPYRICGYYANDVDSGYTIIEHKGGAPKSEFGGSAVLLPNLPDNWRGTSMTITDIDADRMPSIPVTLNICCRCAKTYKNRKEHRKVCK